MAICEVCGNDYDKAFEVNMMGATHTFDSLRMRHACAGASLRALRRARRGPRGRAGRPHLLLRALRRAGGQAICAIAPEAFADLGAQAGARRARGSLMDAAL